MGTNVVVCCGSTLILTSHIMALDVPVRVLEDPPFGYDIGGGGFYGLIKAKYMKAVLSISRSCDSISCREDDNATHEAYQKIEPRRGCLVLAAQGT